MLIPDRPKAILSPCIGTCALDVDGLCAGCHRTADEIAYWMYYTDAERAHLMHEVLPRRTQKATDK
jgi:predicted Fe-S protein YdhL (DUF1289 family)